MRAMDFPAVDEILDFDLAPLLADLDRQTDALLADLEDLDVAVLLADADCLVADVLAEAPLDGLAFACELPELPELDLGALTVDLTAIEDLEAGH